MSILYLHIHKLGEECHPSPFRFFHGAKLNVMYAKTWQFRNVLLRKLYGS